jgi:hypothetical protein
VLPENLAPDCFVSSRSHHRLCAVTCWRTRGIACVFRLLRHPSQSRLLRRRRRMPVARTGAKPQTLLNLGRNSLRHTAAKTSAISARLTGLSCPGNIIRREFEKKCHQDTILPAKDTFVKLWFSCRVPIRVTLRSRFVTGSPPDHRLFRANLLRIGPGRPDLGAHRRVGR